MLRAVAVSIQDPWILGQAQNDEIKKKTRFTKNVQ
jgi:hypothetical protein